MFRRLRYDGEVMPPMSVNRGDPSIFSECVRWWIKERRVAKEYQENKNCRGDRGKRRNFRSTAIRVHSDYFCIRQNFGFFSLQKGFFSEKFVDCKGKGTLCIKELCIKMPCIQD